MNIRPVKLSKDTPGLTYAEENISLYVYLVNYFEAGLEFTLAAQYDLAINAYCKFH